LTQSGGWNTKKNGNNSTRGDMSNKSKFTTEDFYNGVLTYGNASTMRKNAPALYRYGRRNGLLKNVNWPTGKYHSYTHEDWDNAVQTYGNARTMIKEASALYAYGRRRGWAKNTDWPREKSRIGHSKEQLKAEVFEHSRKFHSRGEFAKKAKKDYYFALNNGLLDDMPWLKPQENPFVDRKNYIYVYVFELQKTVYVGETFHGSNRHNDHRRRGPVFNFAKENGIEIPEPIILEDNLNRLNEVRKQEHYWKLHYISLGYKTLNKAKTGEFSGSLGAMAMRWTQKKCREVALLCSHATEMVKRFPSAYQSAWKHGWLKDYTWFTVISGKAKSVLQYAIDGRLVGRWDSVSIAGRAQNFDPRRICACCKGKRKSAYGFVWKYADEAIPA